MPVSGRTSTQRSNAAARSIDSAATRSARFPSTSLSAPDDRLRDGLNILERWQPLRSPRLGCKSLVLDRVHDASHVGRLVRLAKQFGSHLVWKDRLLDQLLREEAGHGREQSPSN